MKKGFTLIELAMVLIVVGLMMGGAFQMMKTMQEKARSTEAKNTLNAAKEAVIAFAINHNRLPTAAVDFPNMNLVGAGNTPIYYNSDAALQANLCGTIATPLNTTDTNGVNTPNIAFVLAVNGENMQAQTTRIGTNITFPAWNALILGFPYDDFHTQVTLAELQSILQCTPFMIINTTLPNATETRGYNANIPTSYPAVGYTINFVAPTVALPTGINFNPATGIFNGTPNVGTANVYTFNITANHATFPPTTRRFAITVSP
ncbi:MAG: putative Ig domain-containing protein [Campylobacterales bacterium]|nr:putative Ig domain-containing protein [Campylobacterales bacterium]